jgi:hypothetical protein
MNLGSVCIECFSLVKCECGKGEGCTFRVRCRENKFKEHLSLDHPFVTLPRDCKLFDNNPEVTDDKKRDPQQTITGMQALPEAVPV